MGNEKITKTPANTVTGLDSVRKRAKRQSNVKLGRGSGGDFKSSLQNIRTLKSIEAEQHDQTETEELAPLAVIAKLWGRFQIAIGNR